VAKHLNKSVEFISDFLAMYFEM